MKNSFVDPRSGIRCYKPSSRTPTLVLNDPVTITQPMLFVSYSEGYGIRGCMLNVCRHYRLAGNRWRYIKGSDDGRLFPDRDAASQYALERGYLQVYRG